jgi:hypothetical protein
MKTEIERHMLPRSTALGMAAAAALTMMLAAAAPARADPMLFIGLQEVGGPIVMYTGGNGPYGTFSHTNNAGLANPGGSADAEGPIASGRYYRREMTPGTLVVWSPLL